MLEYIYTDKFPRGGKTLEYDVVYSARRTLGITVRDGKVTVRAPFGTPDRIVVKAVREHEKWIAGALQKQQMRRERSDVLTEREIAELKKRAKSVLKEKTEYFSKIMDIKYGRITITSARTRFGSCSSDGNIAYSYRLMLYPEEAIDYVVVHELAHRIEMNHSSRFYAIVEKILPDYKERRKLLKK